MTTSEKTCFKCDQVKPLSDFYKHPQMGDGHLNKCKSCTKVDVRKNRQGKLDYYQQYDKDRYRSNDERRSNVQKWYRNKTAKSPAMVKANRLVSNAIRDGKIERRPCEVCGEAKSEAHHCDYLKPFDIMWLCRSHHVKWHQENGSGKNAECHADMVSAF